MEIRNATIEAFLKSFAFSVLLCLYCAFFAVLRARALLRGFDSFELLHFTYNVTLALFFLIRTRPSVVSMNLTHWVVALVTSLSGFLFARTAPPSSSLLSFTGDALIAVAILYDRRAKYEEDVLSRDSFYVAYLRRVKYRFIPGIY